MELSWLETFIILAETGSVRGAASRLGISPATTSERIAALEDALGTTLLERTSKGSELTEAGRLYLSSASQILENWNSLKSLIKPLESSSYQRLSIGLPDHVIFPGLGRFLDNFMVSHPQIELSLFSDQEVMIEGSLRSMTCDVFFAFEPSEGIRRSFNTTSVHLTSMGVLIPQDHRLAFKSSVSLNELDGETFILYPKSNDSTLHDFQKNMLDNSGIRYLEYGGHFSASLYALPVKMECGLAIFPAIMKRGLPPRTKFLELSDDSAQCRIYMIWDPDNSNPALKLFLDEYDSMEGKDES